MGSSFLFGLAAVLIVMLIGRIRTNSPTLTIVLAGVVVCRVFFSAMVSLITYVADPYEVAFDQLLADGFFCLGHVVQVGCCNHPDCGRCYRRSRAALADKRF